MAQFLAEAGVIVWFVIVVGALAFGQAAGFAYRPTDKKRRTADAFLRATVFASVVGFAAGVAATFKAVQHAFEASDAAWWQLLIVGTREASGSLILGLAWSAVAAFLLGVGSWREAA